MIPSVETTSALTEFAARIDLPRTLSRIRAVIRDPASDAELAVILVACAALAVAILILVLLIIVTPPERRPAATQRRSDGSVMRPPRPAPDRVHREELNTTRRRPPSRLLLFLTGPGALSVVIVLATMALYAGTSSDRYCSTSCHSTSTKVRNALHEQHAACISCHEGDLVTAAPANALSRARMIIRYGLGARVDVIERAVSSDRCLSCHNKGIGTGTLVGDTGIAMSHAEVMAAGTPCTQCHREAGHRHALSGAKMSDCASCHDGVVASSECDDCHRQEPSASAFRQNEAGRVIGNGPVTYSAVRAARRECGLCHDEAKRCDPCHGTRLPHSPAFLKGEHAGPAAGASRRTCRKCHKPAECRACH